MSETYEIKGVKITPTGGGYYDLTHASLADPERVRGKEKADQRAEAIAAANPVGTEAEAPLIQDAIPPAAPVAPAPDAPAPPEDEDPRDAQIRALREQMDQMLTVLQQVTTVQAQAGPPQPQVPGTIPRQFAGQMDPATKAALAEKGIKVETIVLEENESIPPTGLFIGHNGNNYMIKPGEEVDVPDFLLSVLDDAVMSAPQVDSTTQKILGYRNRSKYPYRRV